MKKIAVVFFALCSVSSLASVDLFSAIRAGDMGAMHFNGSGVYYEKLEGDRGKYLVALTITPLDSSNDKRRAHFDWHYVSSDGDVELYGLILEGDHELLTVYVPKNPDSLHDLSTYKKAGWGYVAFGHDPSKQFVFLHYVYHNGDKYDEHFLIEQEDDGRLVITSNGTTGNDEDGMNEIWRDRVTQMN